MEVEPHEDTLYMDRLKITAKILKDPKVYNSDAGRKLLHFFYQQFADPAVGDDDLLMAKLIDRLDAGEKIVETCFRERKEFELGYVPSKNKRSDATEEWVIQVSHDHCSSRSVAMIVCFFECETCLVNGSPF